MSLWTDTEGGRAAQRPKLVLRNAPRMQRAGDMAIRVLCIKVQQQRAVSCICSPWPT